MKISNLFSIFLALMLLSALFVPTVMAQENEKQVIREMPQVNGELLEEDDTEDIENLIYLLLDAQGVEIENLDLSQLKVLQSEESSEFGGQISYDFVNDKGVHVPYSTELYFKYDFSTSSFQTISKSGGNYYEMDAAKSETGDFILSETSVSNGIVQKRNDVISVSEIKSVTLSEPDKSLNAQKYDLDSYPPFGSTLMYNDASASKLLTATGIVTAIIGLIPGLTVIGVTGIATGLVELFFESISGVATSDIYVDAFSCPPSPMPYFPPGNAIGIGYPNFPLYLEVDYYYA